MKLCRHSANLIQIKTCARRPRQTAAMTLHAPQAPCFDAELIRRYDVVGPRYTSYPTAPQFHADFGEAALRAE
ncbi:hypothetical protein B1806_05380, partial [Metallibacterium scheffleri]